MNPWFVRNPSIPHPTSSDLAGTSLQDIRNLHIQAYDRMDDVEDGLRSESEEDVGSVTEDDVVLEFPITIEPWYLKESEGTAASTLCGYCRSIDFAWLLRNETSPRNGAVLLLQDMLANVHTCRFCRLAVKALCTSNGISSMEDLLDAESIIYCAIYSIFLAVYAQGPYLTIARRRLFKKGADIGLPGHVQGIGDHGNGSLGRRISASVADMSLIKRWITECEHEHNGQLEKARDHANFVETTRLVDSRAREQVTGTFYAIDLVERCIKSVEPIERYVVLSYVWGRAKQLRHVMSNHISLMSEGSLAPENYGALLPRTILDAMYLASRLGERYLWVDALCLVQDGPSFAKEVQNMDRVYSMAAWCLVAASARDADSSLPRIGHEDHTRTEFQHVETIRGDPLTVMLPFLAVYLNSSLWNTRAWTYQESVLSTRLLIVSESQMYFTCHHGLAFYEDRAFERAVKQASYRPDGHIHGVQRRSNIEVYAGAVAQYTRRQISFPEDTINAFSGVLSMLQDYFQGPFLVGLPSTEIDQALLWYPLRDQSRRKSKMGEDLFPSWAWAGWVGGVHYLPELVLSRVKWRNSRTGAYFTSDEYRSAELPRQNSPWYRDDWQAVEPDKDKGWLHFFHEKSAPHMLYLHPIATSSHRWEDLFLGGGQRLQFRALSCSFHISGTHCDQFFSICACVKGDHQLCALEISNSAGQVVGTIHVPGSISSSLGAGKFDFVRLSRARLVSGALKIPPSIFEESKESDEHTGWDDAQSKEIAADHQDIELDQDDAFEFDTSAFDINVPWCVYNVMLVVTEGGISRRLGVGKVHVDAFLGESPMWKDFVLE